MSRARFFLTGEPEFDEAVDSPLPLTTADARHAARVLRIDTGEHIDVVAPSGRGWRVEVTDVVDGSIRGRVVEPLPAAHRASITLFQGVAKGEKMDSIVRQAVEVGAVAVVPVMTSRTIVRLDPRKRAERGERWRRIAESAAKQARRETVPAVSDPVDLAEAVALLGGYDRVLVLWEDRVGHHILPELREAFANPRVRLALFVGPEGGLSVDEVSSLESLGARSVSLGPSVLRTETAAVVALGLAAAVGLEAAGHES